MRTLLRVFFRRIEVTGAENVPARGGGVYVAWHPNGLLDPALILTRSPRRVVFGARHTLFDWPLLGTLIRALGTVPIQRPQESKGQDAEELRREANRKSLAAMAEAVASGAFVALFPEGLSHDEPRLTLLRPGAARLFSSAVKATPLGASPPVLIPVGLHYNRKNLFGSAVLVDFHPAIELPDELTAPGEEDALTSRIGEVLTDVIQATDDWEIHALMHRLRKLVRSERAHRAEASPGAPTMHEQLLGFARVRQGYALGQVRDPERTETLRERVEEYDESLRALGLEDHDLDAASHKAAPLQALLLVGQAAIVYLLLPPLLVLGYVVNVPLALALGAMVRRIGAQRKDEATLKLLFGALIFPLTWVTVSLMAAWGVVRLDARHLLIPADPWAIGVVTFLLCSVGGWLGLRYLRVAAQVRRSVRARLTRRRQKETVAFLRTERSEIFDEVIRLSEGFDLPGKVARDGRVAAS